MKRGHTKSVLIEINRGPSQKVVVEHRERERESEGEGLRPEDVEWRFWWDVEWGPCE